MCSSERCIKNHQGEYDILPSYRKSKPSAYWMTYKCPTRGTGPWGGPSQVYTLSLLLRVRPHIDTLTADGRTHLIQPGQSDSAPGGVGSRLRQLHSLLLVMALGRQIQQLRTCYFSSYSWSLGELFFRESWRWPWTSQREGSILKPGGQQPGQLCCPLGFTTCPDAFNKNSFFLVQLAWAYSVVHISLDTKLTETFTKQQQKQAEMYFLEHKSVHSRSLISFKSCRVKW